MIKYECKSCHKIFHYKQDLKSHSGLCVWIMKQEVMTNSTKVLNIMELSILVKKLTERIIKLEEQNVKLQTDIQKLRRNISFQSRKIQHPDPTISFQKWVEQAIKEVNESNLKCVFENDMLIGCRVFLRERFKSAIDRNAIPILVASQKKIKIFNGTEWIEATPRHFETFFYRFMGAIYELYKDWEIQNTNVDIEISNLYSCKAFGMNERKIMISVETASKELIAWIRKYWEPLMMNKIDLES